MVPFNNQMGNREEENGLRENIFRGMNDIRLNIFIYFKN